MQYQNFDKKFVAWIQLVNSQLESLCPMAEFINRNKCPFASGPKKRKQTHFAWPRKRKKHVDKIYET